MNIIETEYKGFRVDDQGNVYGKRGNILKEAISRETVRKILNNEEVSLKTIIGNPNFMEK